ncbi:MAG TPA: hypothetical protein VF487_00815 [Chitinophagaceae bacterium]
MKKLRTVVLFVFTSLLILSCRKESFITSPDARVRITVDTLKYDTVFTTAGSITQSFKIVNENNQKLRLTSVKLMGGPGSAYKINVDGTTGPEVSNLEIEANDSIYVFAQVNINPTAANLPFIVRDSIQVNYNGIKQLVQLEAFGRNAHFLRNKQVLVNETWNNDLPYVILGYLYIDTNQTLTINKGCRIYMHADAPIIVDGTLLVNGSKDTADRVYFQGDRLDDPYKDFPASWPGIYFLGSSISNVLNYAVIKNGYQSIGVQDSATNGNPKLTLNECIIDNAFDAGIIGVNSSIRAKNCLISNCGKNIYLTKGGKYDFTHCTVVSISNNFIQHKKPVLFVANYDVNNNQRNLDALFRNCIFWGENGLVDNEVVVEKKGTTFFNVEFDQALWKVQTTPANIISSGIINNTPPLFDSINVSKEYYNFHLKIIPLSPAIDKGNNITIGSYDLDNKQRINIPDLGCYENN